MYQKTVIENSDDLLAVLGDQMEGSETPSLSKIELEVNSNDIHLFCADENFDVSMVNEWELITKILNKYNIDVIMEVCK